MDLPDNEFSDVVRNMRNDGKSWSEIHSDIDRTYDVVDQRTVEERTVDLPAVKITFRDMDDTVKSRTWGFKDGEDVEDVVERARNAPAIQEVLEYEDGHTESVFQ